MVKSLGAKSLRSAEKAEVDASAVSTNPSSSSASPSSNAPSPIGIGNQGGVGRWGRVTFPGAPAASAADLEEFRINGQEEVGRFEGGPGGGAESASDNIIDFDAPGHPSVGTNRDSGENGAGGSLQRLLTEMQEQQRQQLPTDSVDDLRKSVAEIKLALAEIREVVEALAMQPRH